MTGQKIPLIFVPTTKQKEKNTYVCDEIINIIEKNLDEVEEKIYAMQTLMESFEEHFDADLRNSISITENKKQNGNTKQ